MNKTTKSKRTTTETFEESKVINYSSELLNALRSVRAPRGRAEERNELMREVRLLSGVLNSMLIMSIGNESSTYDGAHPETIGEAVKQKQRELHELGEKCRPFLSGYTLNLANPPTATQEKGPLPELDDDKPVLTIEKDAYQSLELYHLGWITLTELARLLLESGLEIRNIRQSNRGDFVHGEVIDRNGRLAVVVVHPESGAFTSVVI